MDLKQARAVLVNSIQELQAAVDEIDGVTYSVLLEVEYPEKKIPVIKMIRKGYGYGLKDAKDYVDVGIYPMYLCNNRTKKENAIPFNKIVPNTKSPGFFSFFGKRANRV